MKRPDVELPEEKRFRRQLERQHGDMLPGSLGALEAVSEQFKDSAPINVYWFLAHEWERKNPYAECVHEVTLNYNESAEKTFHIPTDFRHELKPRKVRRLTNTRACNYYVVFDVNYGSLSAAWQRNRHFGGKTIPEPQHL